MYIYIYVYWKYHDISKHLQLSAQIPMPNIKATTPLEFSLPSKRLDPLQDLQGVLPSSGTLQCAGAQTWSKSIEIKRVRGVGFYPMWIVVIIIYIYIHHTIWWFGHASQKYARQIGIIGSQGTCRGKITLFETNTYRIVFGKWILQRYSMIENRCKSSWTHSRNTPCWSCRGSEISLSSTTRAQMFASDVWEIPRPCCNISKIKASCETWKTKWKKQIKPFARAGKGRVAQSILCKRFTNLAESFQNRHPFTLPRHRSVLGLCHSNC